MKNKIYHHFLDNVLAGNSFYPLHGNLMKKIGLPAAGILTVMVSKRKAIEESLNDANKNNPKAKYVTVDWFYYTLESMSELTGMSEFEINTQIAKLDKLNIISIEHKGMPKKRYFKINDTTAQTYIQNNKYTKESIKEYIDSTKSNKKDFPETQKVGVKNIKNLSSCDAKIDGHSNIYTILDTTLDTNAGEVFLTDDEQITEYNNGLAIACEPNGFVASNNEETVQISDYKDCYDEVLSVMDKVTDIEIDNSKKDNRDNTEMELPNEQKNYSISPQQTIKQKVKQKKTTEQTKFTIEKYPHDDYYKKIALLINENRGRFSPIKFITEKFICGIDNMLELVSEQDYETALINMFDKDSYVQYPNYSSDLYTYIFDKDKIIQFLEIDFKAERERKEKKLMFDKYVSLFKETFQYSYSTKDNYHNATQLFFALSREQMECAILNIPEVLKRESVEPKIDEYLYKELYIIPETVAKEEIIEEEIILVDENELDI